MKRKLNLAMAIKNTEGHYKQFKKWDRIARRLAKEYYDSLPIDELGKAAPKEEWDGLDEEKP